MSYNKPGYHTLYKATFPNGKVYIGITCQYLQKRIWRHITPSQNINNKRPMYRALQKYKNEVVWETILTFDKKEDSQAAEIAYISYYKSNNYLYGYNITEGGESNAGIKRPELLKKLIDNSGNIFNGFESAMSYYNFSRAQIKGSIVQGNYCGHIYFSYYVEGMTKALHRTVSNKYKRKVFDHINQITFFSVTDACQYHNITQANLANMCRRKNNPKFSFLEKALIKCQD